MQDGSGAVSGVLAHGIDLTERKRAEAALTRVTADSERRRRLYETVLFSTPDFVYVFSLDYRVLYANDALLAMWDCGPQDAVGKSFLDLGYEPAHAEKHCREIDRVRATRRPRPPNGTAMLADRAPRRYNHPCGPPDGDEDDRWPRCAFS